MKHYHDTFKYLGVILVSSLFLNQHINYVKQKVSRMTIINRLFKLTILPSLDYWESLECIQGQGGKVVLNTAYIVLVHRTDG